MSERDWHRRGVFNLTEIRKRPFPIRFLRSYRLYRCYLSRRSALLAAWVVSRS